MLAMLKRDKFGSTSERLVDVPPEQLLFNEIEKQMSFGLLPEETEHISYNRKKGRGAKKPCPDDLPRE